MLTATTQLKSTCESNCTALYLLSWAAICSGGEGEEHGVPQEGQVGLEPRHTQPRPQVDRQAALNQSADQLTEGSCQGVFLTARLDLIQLHLRAKDKSQIFIRLVRQEHTLLTRGVTL